MPSAYFTGDDFFECVFRVINVITIVTLLKSLSLHQQDTSGGTLKIDTQRHDVYPLIDVVKLTKNCSTL